MMYSNNTGLFRGKRPSRSWGGGQQGAAHESVAAVGRIHGTLRSPVQITTLIPVPRRCLMSVATDAHTIGDNIK